MVLIFFRLVFQSLAMPCRLSSSLHFPPPVCILFRPRCLSISPRSTCSCPSSSFSLPRPLLASLPLNLALCPASAGLFMSSAYAPIFIPLRCLSLSFCILNCPYPASFPFLALQSISPGLLLYLIFHFLPASQSRPASPLLLLLLRAILLCSRCSARRKYSLFAPPLDMAKEAICALLAILEHFFEAFSPLDLFFAPEPFRPAPRSFPASLHPDCRRFPPLPIPFLHRFQPIPSPARPPLPALAAPSSPCQLRAVRTRPLSTHAGF